MITFLSTLLHHWVCRLQQFSKRVEVLHEQFVKECIDRDQYLLKMYQFTKKFNEEQDGDALKAGIDKILNK